MKQNEGKASLTEKELDYAFIIWKEKYPYHQIDQELEPYLSKEIKEGNSSFLQKCRCAQFLSQQTVAKKLKMSKQAYSQLEKSEILGTITLNKLKLAAEVLNCELVYAIRPKSKLKFSQIVWNKILPIALCNGWLKVCDQKQKARALAAVVKREIIKPNFREKMGWVVLTHE